MNESAAMSKDKKRKIDSSVTDKATVQQNRSEMPEGFTKHLLHTMIESLNNVLEHLHNDFTHNQSSNVYKKLCTRTPFNLQTVQRFFTLEQFIKCSFVRFPEKVSDNIILSKDRTKWVCTLCGV